MKKQVKFSMEEVNLIVGKYVLDEDLLEDVKSVDICFHYNDTIKLYILQGIFRNC